MKERNEEYEKKFRKYLFSFDFETHKKICKNLNVEPKKDGEGDLEKYKIGFNLLMEYFDFIPNEDKEEVSKELNKIGL